MKPHSQKLTYQKSNPGGNETSCTLFCSISDYLKMRMHLHISCFSWDYWIHPRCNLHPEFFPSLLNPVLTYQLHWVLSFFSPSQQFRITFMPLLSTGILALTFYTITLSKSHLKTKEYTQVKGLTWIMHGEVMETHLSIDLSRWHSLETEVN